MIEILTPFLVIPTAAWLELTTGEPVLGLQVIGRAKAGVAPAGVFRIAPKTSFVCAHDLRLRLASGYLPPCAFSACFSDNIIATACF
jgi:hypothetical protein